MFSIHKAKSALTSCSMVKFIASLFVRVKRDLEDQAKIGI